MHNINALNKKDLEREFAEDFSSPIFPILGELYLKNKELDRAKKVCTIGLQHDPNNINGYYILAKVHLYSNELNKAEELLVEVIDKKPLHINALRLIINLHEELNVAKTHQLKYLKKMFHIFPDNKKIENKINNLSAKSIEDEVVPKHSEKTADNIVKANINFNIQPSMATLTFVEILKEQRHYEEALHVLSLIESKSQKNKQTKKLKNELKKLLAEV